MPKKANKKRMVVLTPDSVTHRTTYSTVAWRRRDREHQRPQSTGASAGPFSRNLFTRGLALINAGEMLSLLLDYVHHPTSRRLLLSCFLPQLSGDAPLL